MNHSGFMPHIRVTVEEGRISKLEVGGEYGDRLKAVIERFKDVQYPGYPKPGYHFLNDATIGSNGKASERRDIVEHRDPVDRARRRTVPGRGHSFRLRRRA